MSTMPTADSACTSPSSCTDEVGCQNRLGVWRQANPEGTSDRPGSFKGVRGIAPSSYKARQPRVDGTGQNIFLCSQHF